MLQLSWVKSLDNKWLNLQNLDLTHVHATGVYMIWHGGDNPRIVRIGHGNIAGRLTAHQLNHQITRFATDGPLMVTWTEVEGDEEREGIALYLTQQFSPLVKEKLPETQAVVARSPFA